MATPIYDFIVVGGGIAGATLASRLHERLPSRSILLIEAGPDVSDHHLVNDIKNSARLVGSELDWNYSTVPQHHLNNRICPNNAGKALGGGSAINAGEYPQFPQISGNKGSPHVIKADGYVATPATMTCGLAWSTIRSGATAGCFLTFAKRSTTTPAK